MSTTKRASLDIAAAIIPSPSPSNILLTGTLQYCNAFHISSYALKPYPENESHIETMQSFPTSAVSSHLLSALEHVQVIGLL